MRLNLMRSEYRNLVKLGTPVMVTQLGVIVVSFADTMMVAAYGTKELAASAFVNSIFMVAIVMLFGFAGGLTPLVGALFGRRDLKGVGEMLRAGAGVNLGIALIFTLLLGVAYFFTGHLGQPEELMPLVRPYYLTLLGTLVPMAVFNAFQQTSNGCTDTALPMWLVIGGNILNIIGNYLLIFGKFGCPELGLTGAGVSTLVSRWAQVVAMIAVYRFTRNRRLYWEAWKNAGSIRGLRRQVWETSWPVMLQSGAECFLWSFGAVVCGWFGTVQLASYQIVNTIAQLGFMVYMGFGVAASIRVANLTGLHDVDGVRRVSRASLHLILLLAALSSLLFWLCFRPLVHLFTADEAVATASWPLLLPLVLYQFGDAVQLNYANSIRGTSDVKPLLWCAAVSYLVVGVPTVLLLASGLGGKNVGVYYSFTVALMTASLLYFISFRKIVGRMSRMKV